MTGHLYVALADQIKQQIDQGIFRAGDRLPSVRRQSTQHGVSISTVLQAYGQLQDRRIIEPRPQSGYFVLSKAKLPARPRTSTPSVQPTEVNIGLLAMEVLRATSESLIS
ncbi:MAG: winged helix-turn-helix transcriptional regulator [Gammaproteobacteria bacterium]|nr:winged helix-turn-helix transcriptional regulator [Gammaproteobacteria bacterium]